MLKSQKHVFWLALLLTILVFSLGMLAGALFESYRSNRIENYYLIAELNLLDARIQRDIYTLGNFDCENAIQENIDFADRIFREAIKIQKYEDANQISEKIIMQHKKYDLLRTLFWINSIEIKKVCNASYKNVVYFYQYNQPGIDKRAKQIVFSKLLGELKEKKGHEIMLIPIAADNNLAAINLMLKKYNITELPTILINEEKKITELSTLEEFEKSLE